MAGRQGLKAPWKNARTVRALGDLTAAWLEGRGPRQPGYLGKAPDPETAPLIPVLAAACRAGFVTTQSQPGHPKKTGWGGHVFEQRAAVEGWVSDRSLAASLRSAAGRADLKVVMVRPGFLGGSGVPATRMDGEDCAWFGRMLGHRKQIAYDWPGLSGPVVEELGSSIFLSMVDPEWGRVNRLWDTIARSV